jgi:16S rRNA processing protein RimM
LTEWVSCGRIGRAIGLKGECAVFWNDVECPVGVGGELFVEVKDGSEYRSYKIAALRKQGRFDVVRLEGIESREAAQELANTELVRPAESLPELPEGQYYCYQILGMGVWTDDGSRLGTVDRIFTAGENDVYEVLPDGGKRGDEILIPAIKEVVLSVDVEAKRMVIRPMKGMLD